MLVAGLGAGPFLRSSISSSSSSSSSSSGSSSSSSSSSSSNGPGTGTGQGKSTGNSNNDSKGIVIVTVIIIVVVSVAQDGAADAIQRPESRLHAWSSAFRLRRQHLGTNLGSHSKIRGPILGSLHEGSRFRVHIRCPDV